MLNQSATKGGGSPQLYYHDCSGQIPGHTTRAPPAGFELETNGFQFYAICHCQLGQDIPKQLVIPNTRMSTTSSKLKFMSSVSLYQIVARHWAGNFCPRSFYPSRAVMVA